MKYALLTVLAASVAVSFPALTSPCSGQESADFQPLFNGNDLTNWNGDSRLWSVKDGVIHGETTADVKTDGNTFLIWTGGQPSDFELSLSFRCSSSNNSGIQYRSQHVTDGVKNKWVVRGYQHEIRNSVEFPSVAGFIYGEGLGRGRICLVGEKMVVSGDKKDIADKPLITEEEYKQLFKLDDWNEVRIVAKGTNIQHYLNGKLILDFTDSPELVLKEGILALQLHQGNPMWAEYKNIKLKKL
jgi:hypothetical protein